MSPSSLANATVLERGVKRLASSWQFASQTTLKQWAIGRDGELKSKNSSDCLQQKISATPKTDDFALQLLAGHGWGNQDSPLSITSEDFNQVLTWLQFPSELLRRVPPFNVDVPHFWEYHIERKDKNKTPSTGQLPHVHPPEALTLAFRVDLRRRAHAMCFLRYNFYEQQMKGLILECQPANRPRNKPRRRPSFIFVEEMLDEDRLRLCGNPLQLFISIIARLETRLQTDISVYCNDLIESEGLINVTKRKKRIEKRGFTLGSDKHDEINAKLYDNMLDLGKCHSSIDTLRRFNSDLKMLFQDLQTTLPDYSDRFHALLDENTAIARRLEVDKTEIIFAQTRLQSGFTILHNLISQRDSRLNTQIAIACKSDSRAMRTIAFLSLLFLPTTFVSAMFSTTIFDFRSWPGDIGAGTRTENGNGNGNGRVVSKGWWIYVLCCLLLTAVTGGAWYIWNRRAFRPEEQMWVVSGDLEQQASTPKLSAPDVKMDNPVSEKLPWSHLFGRRDARTDMTK